jgi:hypothetical protein
VAIEATELSPTLEDAAPGDPPPTWPVGTAELVTETMRLEGVAVLSLAEREAAEELIAAEMDDALTAALAELGDDVPVETATAEDCAAEDAEETAEETAELADAEAEELVPTTTAAEELVDDATDDEDEEDELLAAQDKS